MRFLFSSTFIFFLCFAFSADEDDNQIILSVDADFIPTINLQLSHEIKIVETQKNKAIIEVSSRRLPQISSLMHKLHGRCGGFMIEESLVSALETDEALNTSSFVSPKISKHDLVRKAIDMVQEQNIRETIETLSAYRNRYYVSQTGVDSQKFVGRRWQELANTMTKLPVEYFTHSDYPQKSVILTIKGSKASSETIVIGGHGDSIAGWSPPKNVEAPGADDNASGIATISEAIRILNEIGFVPERTIKFMSYAAEEVGLRGSADIAKSFKEKNENVVGVMQFDMTNFTRNPQEIVLMTDYTDAKQNDFIKELMKTYLPAINVAEDTCGYACSDHASWNRYGFAASIPFETKMDAHNEYIHTAQDTISVSQNRANHAVIYAKLLVAYLIELSQQQ